MKDSESYLKRFTALAKELASHEELVVPLFQGYPGVSEKEISRWEKRLNTKFSPAFKAFYRETNGLQLLWYEKSTRPNSKLSKNFSENDWPQDGFEDIDWADGMINILPLDTVCQAALETKILEGPVEQIGKEALKNNVAILDAVQARYKMGVFFVRPDHTLVAPIHWGWLVSLQENQYRYVNFESYLEFILARKAGLDQRGFYFREPGIKNIGYGGHPLSFWRQNPLPISAHLARKRFPGADRIQFPIEGYKPDLQRSIGEFADPLSSDQLKEVVDLHSIWLKAGGKVAGWKRLITSGLIVPVPVLGTNSVGAPASFMSTNLCGIDFSGMDLRYMNFCGAYAKNANFSHCNLLGALFSDGTFSGADFSGANLERVDFSCSVLSSANFSGANIGRTDFEGCEMEGVNLSDTLQHLAQFNGAHLANLILSDPIDTLLKGEKLANPYLELIFAMNQVEVKYLLYDKLPRKGGRLSLALQNDLSNLKLFNSIYKAFCSRNPELAWEPFDLERIASLNLGHSITKGDITITGGYEWVKDQTIEKKSGNVSFPFYNNHYLQAEGEK